MIFFVRRPGTNFSLSPIKDLVDLNHRLSSGDILPSDEYWDYASMKYQLVENLIPLLVVPNSNVQYGHLHSELIKKDISLPMSFGKYRVLSKTGESEWGRVFICEDDYKLKFKVTEFSDNFSTDSVYCDSLLDEVQELIKLTQFSHRYVTYYGAGIEGKSLYLVEQLQEGQPIIDMLDEFCKLPWDEISNIFLTIADALNNLHVGNHVHGMLGFKSVFVRRVASVWDVKLADYSLVPKSENSAQMFINQLDTVQRCFVAPELMSKALVSCSSDIFAFGQLLYAVLAGDVKFKNRIKIANVRGDVPARIDEFISKCVDPSRSSRIQDAKALIAELKGLMKPLNFATTETTKQYFGESSGSVLSTQSNTFTSVSYSPDGLLIAGAIVDGGVIVWDAKTGNERLHIDAHKDWIHCICFSPDSSLLATASEDGSVRLWEISSGKSIIQLNGDEERFFSVCFSPSGQLVAAGSSESVVKIWGVQSGNLSHQLLGHRDAVLTLDFSADGKFLASGSEDDEVIVWDLESEKIKYLYNCNQKSVWSINFSLNSECLIAADGKGDLVCWHVESGETTFRVNYSADESILAARFSPDGNYIAIAGDSKKIYLLNSNDGSLIFELVGHRDSIWSIGFSPDSSMLVSGGRDKTVRVWELLYPLGSTAQQISDTDESSHKKTETNHSEEGYIDEVSVVNAFHSKVVVPPVIKNHSNSFSLNTHSSLIKYNSEVIQIGCAVHSVVGIAEHGVFAVGSSDNNIRIYNVESPSEPILQLSNHGQIVNLAISPCGGCLACATGENFFRIWNIRKPTEIITNRIHREFGSNAFNLIFGHSVSIIAYSSKGQLATSGPFGLVHLWNIENGIKKELRRKPISAYLPVHTLCFSKDGKFLYAGGEDVCILDVKIGLILGRFGDHEGSVRAIIESPDGKTIVTCGGDGLIKYWNAPSDRSQGTLKPQGMVSGCTDGPVSSIAFSASGNILVSGGFDNQVKVWSPTNGGIAALLEGHTKPVNSVTTVNDDRCIISGSDDGTVRIWTRIQ